MLHVGGYIGHPGANNIYIRFILQHFQWRIDEGQGRAELVREIGKQIVFILIDFALFGLF